MIKLFTTGWIFLMAVISTVLLMGTPPSDGVCVGEALISGGRNIEVTVIGVPPSALVNPVVIVNSSYSMKAAALTLMSGKVYKFELWGVAGRNSGISDTEHANDISGNGIYTYGWYDMRGKAQITAYCSINVTFDDSNSYSDQVDDGCPDCITHGDNVTFISIGGYDMNCAVIIAGGSRESADESANANENISQCDGYIGGVIDLDSSNPAGMVIGDNFAANGKIVITEYDVTPIYTVIFNMNGIGGSAPAMQRVLQGELAMQPDNPVCVGWIFEGWFNDQACTAQWNFDTDAVYSVTMLYAKWTVDSRSVRFEIFEIKSPQERQYEL